MNFLSTYEIGDVDCREQLKKYDNRKNSETQESTQSKQIKLDSEPEPEKALRIRDKSQEQPGLVNYNKSCSFNVLIQQLFNNSNIVKKILQFTAPSVFVQLYEKEKVIDNPNLESQMEKHSYLLTKRFQQFFTKMILRQKKYLKPKKLIERVVDLQNFKRIYQGQQVYIRDYQQSLLILLAQGLALSLSQDQNTHVLPEDLFQGEVEIKLLAIQKGPVLLSNNKSPFYQIVLNPSKGQLNSAIQAIQVQQLSNYSEQYNQVFQAYSLTKLPNMLIFDIERLNFEQDKNSFSKKLDQFTFDKELNLAKQTDQSYKGCTQYILKSIIMHKGTSFLAGNYYIYNYYEQEKVWKEFKDHRISIIDEQNVFLNSFGKSEDKTLCAIQLIYQRLDVVQQNQNSQEIYQLAYKQDFAKLILMRNNSQQVSDNSKDKDKLKSKESQKQKGGNVGMEEEKNQQEGQQNQSGQTKQQQQKKKTYKTTKDLPEIMKLLEQRLIYTQKVTAAFVQELQEKILSGQQVKQKKIIAPCFQSFNQFFITFTNVMEQDKTYLFVWHTFDSLSRELHGKGVLELDDDELQDAYEQKMKEITRRQPIKRSIFISDDEQKYFYQYKEDYNNSIVLGVGLIYFLKNLDKPRETYYPIYMLASSKFLFENIKFWQLLNCSLRPIYCFYLMDMLQNYVQNKQPLKEIQQLLQIMKHYFTFFVYQFCNKNVIKQICSWSKEIGNIQTSEEISLEVKQYLEFLKGNSQSQINMKEYYTQELNNMIEDYIDKYGTENWDNREDDILSDQISKLVSDNKSQLQKYNRLYKKIVQKKSCFSIKEIQDVFESKSNVY